MILTDTELLKFTSKHDGGVNCWVWTAGRSAGRYGKFYFRGKDCLAHRVSYEHYVGLVAEGLVVRHTCRNQLCVNPLHLVAGTQLQNCYDEPKEDRVARSKKAHKTMRRQRRASQR